MIWFSNDAATCGPRFHVPKAGQKSYPGGRILLCNYKIRWTLPPAIWISLRFWRLRLSAKNLNAADIVNGTILTVDNHGLIVDIGLGRDGIVERRDLERIHDDVAYEIGDDVDVMVIRPEDEEGNLLLSVSQARQSEDWQNAEKLMEGDEVYEGLVTEANRGGLILPFGNLRGFVPASHVVGLSRGLNEDDRKDQLQTMVGTSINVKIIEVNWKRRRLVFSQRDAQRERREARKEVLLENLREGEVHSGVVSGLRDFGAFVDLGGADGLIHISELAWHRVKHPGEILSVGDEIEVFVLRLDDEGKRIGLSLKRPATEPLGTYRRHVSCGPVGRGWCVTPDRFWRVYQHGAGDRGIAPH